MAPRVLVVQVAGLGYDFLVERGGGPRWCGLRFRSAESVFPALTCPVQGSFRTASPPETQGMVFNGVWLRELRRPAFWEQSSALVEGPRLWERLRREGRTAGLLFWQQSLGEEVDVLLSPWPIHKHHGGLIDEVYSRPQGLYAELCRRLGKRFKLSSYWGPLASARSSQWIAAATAEVMRMPDVAPDLLLTYLPHLDYALLRHGPSSGKALEALSHLESLLGELLEAARQNGYAPVIFGDYAFADAHAPVYPNRALLDAGLFAVRDVRGRLYPDLHASRAFAVADHEVAHVYVREPSDRDAAGSALAALDGVAEVVAEGDLVAHPRAGDLVLVAQPGAWFAYPWWREKARRPDYATHVDIHNKPGFDPCELFFGWPPPFATSTDATRVAGSHGRVGPGREVAWAATVGLDAEPDSLIALAQAVQSIL
ncbi:MAG: alkaline phosphatase family protein [Candidatus Brocadiia bacterium]